MNAGAPVLDVDDLTVAALGRARPILDAVSLSVRAGETLGIVGESGSGKTTLARSLTRQEKPLEIRGGAMRFAGRDLAHLRERDMRALRGRRIAMVEQDPLAAFDPLFTVGDQIKEFVAAHRDAIAVASETSRADALEATLSRLEAFGVPGARDAAGTRPHQWSRGMLQRALFALATAPAPDVLILDEPTAALDVPVADKLIEDVRRLARSRRVATILITHDLGLAATACDRILVLRNGEAIETGPTATLMSSARSDYARALIASAAW